MILALDGKVSFDDNAMYRHPDLLAMRESRRRKIRKKSKRKNTTSAVHRARRRHLAAWSTAPWLGDGHDGHHQIRGWRAGSLPRRRRWRDTREGDSGDSKIILSDTKVKAIFVNIFGGIMKCDVIADGVITAAKEVQLKVSLVVRMEGTNVEIGRKMLADSGLPIQTGLDMLDGAKKVVAAVKS